MTHIAAIACVHVLLTQGPSNNDEYGRFYTVPMCGMCMQSADDEVRSVVNTLAFMEKSVIFWQIFDNVSKKKHDVRYCRIVNQDPECVQLWIQGVAWKNLELFVCRRQIH